MESCLVVGSGPAGIACAKALVDRGAAVHMLDAGLTLDPERRAFLERFRAILPEDWSKSDLKEYQAGMNSASSGVPQKLVYGSDFAYRDTEKHLRLRYELAGLRPSLAQGGLSNVWGAAMLPVITGDITDWPLGLESLHEHYKAVAELTGLAGTVDDLETIFPLYTAAPTQLALSTQSVRVLDSMRRNRGHLAAARIHFGQSRLAVRGKSPEDQGCVYCRLCMYGCPYELIYSSSSTLTRLQKTKNLHYEPGVIVTAVRESANGVEVSGRNRDGTEVRTWRGSHVFLAAGTIPTTQILLRSLGAYDRTVCLKDSQYFLVPLILFRKVKGATIERSHGLSQIFLEVMHDSADRIRAHVQLYSNSDLVSHALETAFGPIRHPLAHLVRDLQERMLVAQGFLHSQDSSTIAVTLKRSSPPEVDRLELRGQPNHRTKRIVSDVVSKLVRHCRQLGALPLPFQLKVPEPGRSFHSGGSFPMSATPGAFQTDILGRPAGWKRIHAVDATVLPSIPATTITFTVMANAHRIGHNALLASTGRIS
jgi:choline dehydrogenase-like flavoprotein